MKQTNLTENTNRLGTREKKSRVKEKLFKQFKGNGIKHGGLDPFVDLSYILYQLYHSANVFPSKAGLITWNCEHKVLVVSTF